MKTTAPKSDMIHMARALADQGNPAARMPRGGRHNLNP
jgi:hypothetical protein